MQQECKVKSGVQPAFVLTSVLRSGVCQFVFGGLNVTRCDIIYEEHLIAMTMLRQEATWLAAKIRARRVTGHHPTRHANAAGN